MTIETKLRTGIVILGITGLWTTLMWANSDITIKSQKNTIDSLTHENDIILIKYDSLREEHFNISVENGRYELSLDHLKEINPKAGKQFEDYLEHETE